MNRHRALILLAGSGVLAGCATHASPLLHLPAGDSGRGLSSFPRRRPDGSLPPSTASAYRPATQIIGAPAGRKADTVNHICTEDGCPGDGGGGDPGTGPQPDLLLRAGSLLGYYFSSQSYVETWNDDGSQLLDQWFWSIDTSLSQYAAQLSRRNSDVATAGGPSKPCDSCSTHSQSVSVSVSVPNGTFAATHDNGWSITGHADGTGNVALTATAGGDVAGATLSYRPPNSACTPLSLSASAAIAPIVLNVIATTTGCTTAPETCTAGGVLVGAMSAATLAVVRQWQAAQGC